MAGLAPSSGAAPTSLLAPGATAAPSGGLAPSLLLPPSSGSVAPQITGGSSGGWRATTDPHQYSVLDDTITVYEVEDEEALIALIAAL